MRLIDADMLRDAMFHYYGCVNDGTDKSNYEGETLMNYEVADLIEDCISTAPTVDAEPIKHGEWIIKKRSENGMEYTICSNCNKGFKSLCYPNVETTDLDIRNANFCPNCGAKMVEERKEE